ncbi:WD40 repeat-like protein [Patellaria atrata CBS 101060]|uniref:WD40 repeat-like protein n=1 Tax=Patellaria atrata CBS 101060 TaxID=1346257 RepID=A0A9P4VL64_9PEZI|nr:WD40 repeat-like protein [Patellaria atrata CBS 101060]
MSVKNRPTEFPQPKAYIRLGKHVNSDQKWNDVKFYPYTKPGVDPVFAVVGGRDVVVCRPTLDKNEPIQILRWFSDPELGQSEEDDFFTVDWSKDADTGDPLLLVSGKNPKIKILNVRADKLERTLIGHGDAVNHVEVSPQNPSIVASVGRDHSVRIWNLDKKYEKNPCCVICVGHQWDIQSTGFHQNGRYLLTGGMDEMINLWALPELPNAHTGTDTVTRIDFPHFASTEIHGEGVDCTKFYGDLILSKSASNNKIVLWRIAGFNSNVPIPGPSAAPPHIPTPGLFTWSAFSDSKHGAFERLRTFDIPNTEWYFMRFSLFHQPFKRPLLAIGNAGSKIYFWDMQRLEEGETLQEREGTVSRESSGNSLPPDTHAGVSYPSRVRASLKPGVARPVPKRKASYPYSAQARESSTASAASTNVGSEFSVSTSAPSRLSHPPPLARGSKGPKVDIGADPFWPIPPHKSFMMPKVQYTHRQVAWSVGGEWCVASGEQGMIGLYRRWE